MSEQDKKSNPFVRCRFSCRKCFSSGYTKVFAYPEESVMGTVKRHQLQTRTSCVKGCSYEASPQAAVTPANAVARFKG